MRRAQSEKRLFSDASIEPEIIFMYSDPVQSTGDDITDDEAIEQKLSHGPGGFIFNAPTKSVLTKEDTSDLQVWLQYRALTEQIPKEVSKAPSKWGINQQFMGIKHDPLYVQVTKEFETIKNYNSMVESHGLTLPLLRHVLEQPQPKFLHLTFHGEWDDEDNNGVYQFTVEFDSTAALPQLLASNATVMKNGRKRVYPRDYFAAIALFIEEEVDDLVQQRHQLTQKQRYWFRRIDAKTKIFKYKQMRDLVENIAFRRFGCSCRCKDARVDAQREIQIFYGELQNDLIGLYTKRQV